MYVLIGFQILLLCKDVVNGNITVTTGAPTFNKREKAKLPDSCYGRCGQEVEWPCSCDVKCAVYKTCCEDMEQYCNHINQESLRKFSNLIKLDAECTAANYLLITACSTVPKDSNKPLDILSNETRDFVRATPTYWQENSFLNGIPVTDSATGFSFKNVSVYMCNAGNDSYPIKWSLNFDINELNIKGYSSSIIENRTLYFEYFPPPNVTNAARCVRNSVGECKPDSEEEIRAKCLAFKSYEEHNLKSSTIVYNNKYCAKCNGISSKELTPMEKLYKKHNFNFQIISTFVGNTIKFSTTDENVVSWSNFQCVLTELKEVVTFPDGYKCELIDCKTGFHKRPDGQCKALHVLRLGLSTSAFNLYIGVFQKLTSVLRCLLTTYTELEAIGQWKPFRMRYDPRLNLKFMITELVVYITKESSKMFDGEDPSSHIKTLTLIIGQIGHLKKVLHWPHQRTQNSDRLQMIETVDYSSKEQRDHKVDKLGHHINLSQATLCNCILPFNKVGFIEDADCTLKCIHFEHLSWGEYSKNNEGLRGNCGVDTQSNGPRYTELNFGIVLSYLLNILFV